MPQLVNLSAAGLIATFGTSWLTVAPKGTEKRLPRESIKTTRSDDGRALCYHWTTGSSPFTSIPIITALKQALLGCCSPSPQSLCSWAHSPQQLCSQLQPSTRTSASLLISRDGRRHATRLLTVLAGPLDSILAQTMRPVLLQLEWSGRLATSCEPKSRISLTLALVLPRGY